MQRFLLSMGATFLGVFAVAACATDGDRDPLPAEAPQGFGAAATPTPPATGDDGCRTEAECPPGWACSASGMNGVTGVCEEPAPQSETPATFAYTAWSSWSKCSAECGDGTQTRSRRCARINDNASAPCRSCGGTCDETQACKGTTCCVANVGAKCDTGKPDGVREDVPCPDANCVTAKVDCGNHVTKHCYPYALGEHNSWGAPWVNSRDCSVSKHTFFNDFPCTDSVVTSSAGKVQCDGSCK